MKIEKFSASAMEVSELCLARWDANNKAGRVGSFGSRATLLGTTCHYAMEHYVKKAVMNSEMPATERSLQLLYMEGFIETFGSSDLSSTVYKEGWDLVLKWYRRTTFEGFTVLAAEEYHSFDVPTGEVLPDGSKRMIPLNFIFDRFDQTGPTEYRVVDYKSLSQPVSPIDLHEKIQPRIYGLAAQIMHPDATRIWVGFDMLRWEGPIETYYSRQDNIDTWNMVKNAVARIVACDPDEIDPYTKKPRGVPETLNSQCGWCIRKTTCRSLAANISAGGIYSLDLQGQIDARALLKMQAKAAADAVKELDAIILDAMAKQDVDSISTDLMTATATVRGKRAINPDHVLNVAGPDLFAKYGATSITMENLDALLADPDLSLEQRATLESLITREYGNPYLVTKEKKRKP